MGASLTLGSCKEKETVENGLYNMCHECNVTIELPGDQWVLFTVVWAFLCGNIHFDAI